MCAGGCITGWIGPNGRSRDSREIGPPRRHHRPQRRWRRLSPCKAGPTWKSGFWRIHQKSSKRVQAARRRPTITLSWGWQTSPSGRPRPSDAGKFSERWSFSGAITRTDRRAGFRKAGSVANTVIRRTTIWETTQGLHRPEPHEGGVRQPTGPSRLKRRLRSGQPLGSAFRNCGEHSRSTLGLPRTHSPWSKSAAPRCTGRPSV
jgi:hypothetical protein